MPPNHPTIDDSGGPNPAVYTSRELEFFDCVLNDAFGDVCEAGGTLAAPDHVAETKAHLGAAIFRCAAAGERDYLVLKYRAVESLY